MTTSPHPQSTVPVLAACDAVVIGASFAGIAAALELAQAGDG